MVSCSLEKKSDITRMPFRVVKYLMLLARGQRKVGEFSIKSGTKHMMCPEVFVPVYLVRTHRMRVYKRNTFLGNLSLSLTRGFPTNVYWSRCVTLGRWYIEARLVFEDRYKLLSPVLPITTVTAFLCTQANNRTRIGVMTSICFFHPE